MSQPLDDLLTIAERAYVRMQAEQLISQCLDEGDASALEALIQQLVLAGAPSLAVLREIREEIGSVLSSLRQEGLAVRQELKDALAGFGLQMPQLLAADPPEAFRRISGQGLRNEVKKAASGLVSEDQLLLEEICREAGDRVSTIASRLALLGKVDRAVHDWLVSLAYEAAHTSQELEILPRMPRLH